MTDKLKFVVEEMMRIDTRHTAATAAIAGAISAQPWPVGRSAAGIFRAMAATAPSQEVASVWRTFAARSMAQSPRKRRKV